jgi:hypothetical protein
MARQFVATFKGAKGRYLVTYDGGGYGGQRIADRRQLKHGNLPDPETGLWLYESYRSFSSYDLVTIRPFVRQASQ